MNAEAPEELVKFPLNAPFILSLSVTHDGVSVSYDQELLHDIWHAFKRGYKRRIGRFKNNFTAGMFPANTITISLVIAAISIFSMFHHDLSFGILPFIEYHILDFLFGDGIFSFCISLLISGSFIWFVLVQLLRLTVKLLLSYKGWMYEKPGKPVSTPTKLWLGVLKLISKSGPMMHSYQGALPHLPLPSLDDTLERHLLSMRPILNDEEYYELEHLTEVFRKGVGRRLQRYLLLKSWLSTNYVSRCSIFRHNSGTFSWFRMLEACELQHQYEAILKQEIEPVPVERHLAVLTAGERTHWAKTRRAYFRSGVNKTSLNDIERAAFVVILDDEEVSYDKNDPSKLDHWAQNLLHGKGYNRWFDKSFNLIISKNAHVGINTEHSWYVLGDAAVTAHFMEFMLL
ncbi:hypothetical protein OESDEN_15498, partial [Oesophagostomum dentatum]